MTTEAKTKDSLETRRSVARVDLEKSVRSLDLSVGDMKRRLETGSSASLVLCDARGAAGTLAFLIQYAAELSALEDL